MFTHEWQVSVTKAMPTCGLLWTFQEDLRGSETWCASPWCVLAASVAKMKIMIIIMITMMMHLRASGQMSSTGLSYTLD